MTSNTIKSNALAPVGMSPEAKLVKSDTKVLDCKLSDREVLELTFQMHAQRTELEACDARLELEKLNRKTLNSRIDELSKEIGSHEARRPVQVEEWADPARGFAVTVRTDTGQELSRRTLSLTERQGDLDLQ